MPAGRACALFTGGKDSTYALLRAVREGYEVACLATAEPERGDSWMFHASNIHLARLAAEAMGLGGRHVWIRVSGVKEREVDELLEGLRRAREEYGFDTIVVGAIASRYQKARVERVARALGARVYSPQWGMDPREYLLLLVREGVRFIITSITAMGIPPRLLGVPVDEAVARELLRLAERYGFNPAFEGGEAETLAFDSPLHKQGRVCLEARRVTRSEFTHELVVERAWISRGGPCIIVDGSTLA
ncbi:diphthine--ammonia ligase [Stetteria hydrogenophila]